MYVVTLAAPSVDERSFDPGAATGDPAVVPGPHALRSRLIRKLLPPASFRTALRDVPAANREAWVDLLWDIDALPDDEPLPRGCVPYLPCPVATVVQAVEQAAVTRDDIFVDVGAGLGRPALLAHLLTGAGSIGVEIQPALVRAARGRAAWLGLDRVRFIEGDAANLIRWMTIGTVFFLYCPFGGARLDRVLDDLEEIARVRPLRICCVGMPPLNRSRFVPLASVSVDLAVYRTV